MSKQTLIIIPNGERSYQEKSLKTSGQIVLCCNKYGWVRGWMDYNVSFEGDGDGCNLFSVREGEWVVMSEGGQLSVCI